ncbi:MAG TPA: spermidine synthase [Henriciella marina]|uniref:spermine/spermidine synthase domain-containing protein n=1 Tax=Henriciella sp. TaxID=1968823 RepID=UPI0017C0F18B|nr:spermidine synthase [Henriciella sp.]HIG23948.1 spermidine synthase [Henriciella sp.]HIK65386.1 spermidine synthase [Henriciella marina]
MSRLFEEIDYQVTEIGAVSLRRRHILSLNQDVWEVLLGDEHLMSSLFTASEIALAKLGLAALGDAPETGWDVVVGGLGLGYTAAAVLEHESVRSLEVVDFLAPVIEWHEKRLVPLDPPLLDDDRCTLRQADFFALAASGEGFGAPKDVILIDIDHTPDWLLDARSGSFYSEDGLRQLARHLKPGGVMGLWSDALADEAFIARMKAVFSDAWREPVTFHNPLQDRPFTQTVYLARRV